MFDALQTKHTQTEPSEPKLIVEEFTEELEQLRELLSGKSIVIVGDYPGESRFEKYQENLNCQIKWVDTNSPNGGFQSAIGSKEVNLVVLFIHRVSHKISKRVTDLCNEYDKLLVRAPCGYNSNLIAHHTMAQVGDRLREIAIKDGWGTGTRTPTDGTKIRCPTN